MPEIRGKVQSDAIKMGESEVWRRSKRQYESTQLEQTDINVEKLYHKAPYYGRCLFEER